MRSALSPDHSPFKFQIGLTNTSSRAETTVVRGCFRQVSVAARGVSGRGHGRTDGVAARPAACLQRHRDDCDGVQYRNDSHGGGGRRRLCHHVGLCRRVCASVSLNLLPLAATSCQNSPPLPK
jgi:hypothetical protein